uniref:SMC hinge domain-containing protein n=1 Tax=Periophthalmus magnuspinnatus TaxID=409849 RepID=A0A3B4AQM5_9GOBI
KTATFVAGKLFPVFLVTVMSDEGKPIVNKGAVSMLYWKGELSRNAPPNTFQCCEPKETEKKDIFYFREKPIPEHVGNYTIQFCLRDINNEITLRNDQIVINVVANRPTKLAPEIPPPTQVVSYSEDIAKRMLVDNMTLMIMVSRKHGSLCPLYCPLYLSLSIFFFFLGSVGHLAHVMNDSEAWVISWHIRGDMDCVVTTTTAAARQIYNLTNGNQQVLPIDGINPSCRRTLPPLPHIRNGRVLFEPKGNPVYAANVLIYPENQKDCEIVFRNLLGSTILIDDLDSASYYRQSAVRCGEMCQTILTRQGERISSKGKFGGAQNKAPPYNKLEMFGAPVPERYISLQRNIDLLQQYRNALEKKLQHIQEQTKTFNHLDVIIKKNRESLGIMDKQLQEIETQLGMKCDIT